MPPATTNPAGRRADDKQWGAVAAQHGWGAAPATPMGAVTTSASPSLLGSLRLFLGALISATAGTSDLGPGTLLALADAREGSATFLGALGLGGHVAVGEGGTRGPPFALTP